ncbi:aminotransferase class I/II-fold pyridoxal phosphate-dependent enzyme [Lacrimispora sp.]
MFDICRRHGVLVVSDEIHQDFTYEGRRSYPPHWSGTVSTMIF